METTRTENTYYGGRQRTLEPQQPTLRCEVSLQPLRRKAVHPLAEGHALCPARGPGPSGLGARDLCIGRQAEVDANNRSTSVILGPAPEL